jgi:hypothetical protein
MVRYPEFSDSLTFGSGMGSLSFSLRVWYSGHDQMAAFRT